MIFYQWDMNLLYVGQMDVDEAGELPPRSTPTKPPQLTGTQVARWTGSGWEKLEAAPEQPVPEEPVESVIALYESAVQGVMDAAANQRGYDSLATAISYADEPAVPRFQADGQAFRRWRSLVWDFAHTELNAVLAGELEQPELEAFIASLPPLELST